MQQPRQGGTVPDSKTVRDSCEPDAFSEPTEHSRIVPGGRIFWGPCGLRAGWAILVFGCLVYLLIYLLAPLILSMIGNPWQGTMPPSTGLAIELSELVAAALVTLLFAIMERRSLLSYGFLGRARVVRFVSGMAWGFVCITVLVLSLWKLGFLAISASGLTGRIAVLYAAKWGAVFLTTALAEESLFRGYAQFTLTRGIGFWWGALVVALLFGAVHSGNGGESVIGLAAAGAVGLVLCVSLWYTGSLWWAVGFHAAWDWGESYFYGTADSGMVAQGHLLRAHPVGAALWSGGATGPEGSVLVFPLLALIALLMVLWWRKRGERPFAGMGWRGR